jgi:hypothetical protein
VRALRSPSCRSRWALPPKTRRTCYGYFASSESQPTMSKIPTGTHLPFNVVVAAEAVYRRSLLVCHPGCRVVRICACGDRRRCCRLTTLNHLWRQLTRWMVSIRRRHSLRNRRAGRHNHSGVRLARRRGRTARGTTRRGRDPSGGRHHDRERSKTSRYFHSVPNLVPGNPRGQ